MTVDDEQIAPPDDDTPPDDSLPDEEPTTPRDEEPTTPPGDVEPPPATGDAAVDAALERLHERAESGTLDEQAEAAEATHGALQDRLADLGGD